GEPIWPTGTAATIADAVLSSLHHQELASTRTATQRWETSSPSREIFLEMMAAAVLKNSSPNEMKMLSGLAGDRSTLPGWQRQALATAGKVHAGTGESAVAEESKLEPRDVELFAKGRQ